MSPPSEIISPSLTTINNDPSKINSSPNKKELNTTVLEPIEIINKKKKISPFKIKEK